MVFGKRIKEVKVSRSGLVLKEPLRKQLKVLLFVALVVWTWDRTRRDAFDEAARLPFADEAPTGEKQ